MRWVLYSGFRLLAVLDVASGENNARQRLGGTADLPAAVDALLRQSWIPRWPYDAFIHAPVSFWPGILTCWNSSLIFARVSSC